MAPLLAIIASPARAADECGPAPPGGGTIECPTADYPSGISYDAGVEDLTVVVDPGSTLKGGFDLSGQANLGANLYGVTVSTTADFEAGVGLDSTVGDISLVSSEVSTTGDGAAGISSHAADGYTLIYSGNVATTGDGSAGLQIVSDGGDQVIVADFTTTSGTGSVGISAGSKSGDIIALTFGIDTAGDYSVGAQLDSSSSGNITFQNGQEIIFSQIQTTGEHSDAVDLSTVSGNIESRTQNIITQGDFSAGIHAVSGSGNVTIYNGFNYSSGSITTHGMHSDGIHAESGGDIDVISDTIHTYGALSDGMYLSTTDGDMIVHSSVIGTSGNYSQGIHAVSQTGNIDITASNVITAGNHAPAIEALSYGGDASIAAGNIQTSGDYSAGIFAGAYVYEAGPNQIGGPPVLGGDLTIAADQIATTGAHASAIHALDTIGGNVDVSASLISTGGDYSAGIYAAAFGAAGDDGAVHVGNVGIDVEAIGTIGAYSPGLLATSVGGSVVIHAGTVSSSGDRSAGVYGAALGFSPEYGPAAYSFYGGDLTIIADDVTTAGDNSVGIGAISFSGGNTQVTVGTVETSGDYSTGVLVVSDGAFAADNPEATEVVVSSATTHGDQSDAINVLATGGDAQVSVTKASAEGEHSNAVFVSADAGAATIEILKQASSVQGVGVVASAAGNVIVNIADGAQVFGGQVGVYAAASSDGASAHISNQGEIMGPVSIDATAQSVVIDNPGIVIGPVRLTDRVGLFDNSGTWQSFGTSQFGVGSNLVLNTGRLIIGAGQAAERTDLLGLETLDNQGLITMTDGHADQVLNLDRTAFIGGTGSKLAIDVGRTATGLTSDLVKLSVATGATQLQISGSGGLGRTLVIDANASSAAGNFFLTGGAADFGLIRMTLDYDAAKSNWSLVGSPGQEAFEGVRFGAQAQSLWRRGIDVWSQTLNEGPAPERFTFWGRYLTGHENQHLNPTFTNFGVASTPNLNTDARWDGAVLGASFGRGGWTWGALAGVTKQTTRFTFDDNKLRAKGTNFGAYAGWRGDKLFARAIANYQHVRAKADLTTAGLRDTLHGSVSGVRGEMGLDLPLGAMKLEPLVSVTWSHGHFDDFRAPTASLDFHGFTSLEGSVGASLSGAFHAGATTIHPYAGLYGVEEFKGSNALDLDVGSQSLRLVDQPRTTYAKATGGLAADLGRAFRLSVGGEADFSGGRNAVKGLIGLSWRG